ncbi:non-specific lipid transfer protein GPI-anchored 1-like isoform X1 [Zingiber officinale]|uniref:non-specific lipid transfer protein GPI-anchored 1-like n=1 Tax=Zingiber officinale TaxID=94328 RepID=UPI001C4D877D|nr:non-specific lipid transfer protein GPI-anchored 1-like [Zingiber officinale]XP_042393292.1 non-specific lipid transfer protein GPI-anchored 1-like isoform X2 [Zingiber officinale]XP_042450363.1 non-specific lipid transfer protein GPI-anchored 1-like isoform X1 [Zingiber officinale]XP_042474077.1 non-specific lipid transfer protein GPI-anchored 1-like isoform X1 [Zingiber officinale]
MLLFAKFLFSKRTANTSILQYQHQKTRKKKVDNRQEKSPAADTSLQHQCTDATSSLTPCMDYGSGSSDRPNSDCCDTVRNIRGTNPVCLCYAVQQTHNCSSPWSALGLKVERLLMLPGACNLDNSNASNCNGTTVFLLLLVKRNILRKKELKRIRNGELKLCRFFLR